MNDAELNELGIRTNNRLIEILAERVVTIEKRLDLLLVSKAGEPLKDGPTAENWKEWSYREVERINTITKQFDPSMEFKRTKV